MAPTGTTPHNYWHSLAKAEIPAVDMMNQGIHVQMLSRGDVIRFETMRGNDGYASRVTLEVTHPRHGGVKITQVIRFLGRLNLEVDKETTFGPGIRGVFVLRGAQHNEKKLELGWLGVGGDIHLAGGAPFRSIRNISINNRLVIFPPSSAAVQ